MSRAFDWDMARRREARRAAKPELREMRARYGGKCGRDCGKPIQPGDPIIWQPGCVFHVDCHSPGGVFSRDARADQAYQERKARQRKVATSS